MNISHVMITVLTVCLIGTVSIHLGYIKHTQARFKAINLAYLFSLHLTAINSIALKEVPQQSIPAGSNTEDVALLNLVVSALTSYLQLWHMTLIYMFNASRIPMIQLTMSVSHQTTYLDDANQQVAYGFEVTITSDGEAHSFPLVVSNLDATVVMGKMAYHIAQLEQLVNQFVVNGKGSTHA